MPVGRNGDVEAAPSSRVRGAPAWLLLGLLAAAPLAAAQAPITEGDGGGHRVLGRWENPLPAPLDGPFGTFLLDILAWLAIAAFARLLLGPALQSLASRTKTPMDDKVVNILATPVFFVILLVGIRASVRAFVLPAGVGAALDVAGTLILIAVVAYILFRAWNEVALVYARRLAAKTQSTIDNRALPLLEKLGGVLIIVFAAVASLQALGVGLSWLLAGGAFVSIVIGLAAQDTLSNFFSGIHLLVDQPFREGDEIQMESGPICTVRRVGLRSTHLYNRQTHDLIIVPNNLLSTRLVTNKTRPDRKQRLTVEVAVAYGSDPDKVKRILVEAALAHPLVLREPGNEPQVRLTGFGDFALTFAIIFWVGDHAHRMTVPSDLRIAVLRRFTEAGIEIPSPKLLVPQEDGADPDADAKPTPPSSPKP
ncbi:MAG: MscS family rane protein [Thermoplasmata archaeon]|nr:MscS family rane protein [Thermoplasmata archaeon]